MDSTRLVVQISFAIAIGAYGYNYLVRGQTELSTSYLALIGILAGTMLALQVSQAAGKPIEETPAGKKIQEAESRLEQHPEKSRFAWDLARITLESYFHRNLSQITWIFWLSVLVMIAGFGIILYGISQTVSLAHDLALKANGDKNSLEAIKTLPGIISTLAGLVTEFIGATFLFIYRSTIQQATNYSQTLERINSIGMAMQIFDTMPDTTRGDDLKSYTKARTIELLVRGAYEQSAKLPKVPTPRAERDKTKKAKGEEKEAP
jgi:hypothetical protein